MSKLKSQRFSLRLLIDQEWISPLEDLAKAHLVSRLALIRRYIREGMTADLETVKEGINRLKNIEATKRELNLRVKKQKGMSTSSINEPLDY
jgi:hypothetical protein